MLLLIELKHDEILNNSFQWFSSSAVSLLQFYWHSGTPRGLAVTRFPGSRQEEEKQNKPERAVTACGLH